MNWRSLDRIRKKRTRFLKPALHSARNWGSISRLREVERTIAAHVQFQRVRGIRQTLHHHGRDPLNSLAAARPTDFSPWQACMRPWTTAYVTANGNCLPCCISPFATNDYDSLLLGNLFERPFAEIWQDRPYQDFRKRLLSDHPNQACSSCGVYWSI